MQHEPITRKAQMFERADDPAPDPVPARRLYRDSRERVAAALDLSDPILAEYRRRVVERLNAEYGGVNNYVSDRGVLDLMQSVLWDMQADVTEREA